MALSDFYYDMTNLSNQTSLIDTANYANEVTGGLFWIIMLIPLWVILFVSFNRWGSSEAFAGASFTTSLISYFMAALGLFPAQYILAPTLLLFGSIVILLKRWNES